MGKIEPEPIGRAAQQAFFEFNPGWQRRDAVDRFLVAINAAMGGNPIDRNDSPYIGLTNTELAAIAADEAEVRGVPYDTIKFLIAVHSSA